MSLFQFVDTATYRKDMALLNKRVATLEALVSRIARTERRIMSALDDLTDKVATVTSVEASALVLIQGIVEQLKNMPPDDSAALAALTAQLDAATAPLAAAVAANTAPAAPTAPTP